ncbi:MAG TPA: hypothetical protein VGB62_00125 [Allosphingosinicella sp.]
MEARARRGGAAMTVALHGALLLLLLSYRPSQPLPRIETAPTDLLFLPPAEPPPEPESEAVELKTVAEEAMAPSTAVLAPPAAPRPAGAPAPAALVQAPPAPLPTITPLKIHAPPAGGAAGGTGSGTGTAGTGTGGGGSGGGGSGSGGQGAARPTRDVAPPGGASEAVWILKPTPTQLANARPFLARREGLAGRVKLSCLVDERNRARRCRVVSERPLDYGFGQSARRLSEIFLIKPPIVDGKPSYTTRVTVDIVWEQVGP